MHDPLVVAFEIKRVVTVWHREPDGHDAGEVCRMHSHDPDRGWIFYSSWRWHIHHWHIQIPAYQRLRRSLLTRCEWCGGRSTKQDPVNVRHGDRIESPWWRGARGVYHMDCSSVPGAKQQCLCDEPSLLFGEKWGECLSCGNRRYGELKPHIVKIRRLYASVPAGQQPSDDVLRQIAALAEPGTVRSYRARNLEQDS